MKSISGLVAILLLGVALAQDAPQPPAPDAVPPPPAPAPDAPPAAAAPAPAPVEPAAPAEPKAPPMYAVHDFATRAMQERMKLANGDQCDLGFGSKVEKAVNEMEKSKDGSEDLANTLRTDFKALMDGQSDKNLCMKESWCDNGVCKVRGPAKPVIKAKGRSMQKGKGRAAEGEAAEAATGAAAITTAAASVTGGAGGDGGSTTASPETTVSGSSFISGSVFSMLLTLGALFY